MHLLLSQNLSFADAVTGQTVEFEVVDDVIVNGLLVIAHGSTAWATVTDAEHKKRMHRAGKLDLNIDKVRPADGEKALLRTVGDARGGGHTGAMVGAMVATSLVDWPAAPLFLFMHGKDVTIPKGTSISAFVQGDITLDESRSQRGGGPSSAVSGNIELTLLTPERIEGRSFTPPPKAKLDWDTCSYTLAADRQSFVLIPVR